VIGPGRPLVAIDVSRAAGRAGVWIFSLLTEQRGREFASVSSLPAGGYETPDCPPAGPRIQLPAVMV